MAARRADIILTVSKFSKGEIMKYYQVDSDKVTITPLAADNIFTVVPPATISNFPFTKERIMEATKNKFILSVGSIFNRRHIQELIEAIKLLIVGANHTQPFIDVDEIIKKTNKNLGRRAIIREDYVSEKDLAVLYNLAQCSVYLSDYEGFGLPLLESMASGTPVITSRKTSLVEAGGEAAIFVDSNNPSDIYGKIKKVLVDDDFKEERIRKGLENARKFSWKKCAGETLEVFLKLSFRA